MDELKIHLNIIKIFVYNFQEENNEEYLFVGDCPNEIRLIIEKVESDKNISKDEESKLELVYGKHALSTLKSKINDDTELIYESIYYDDKIIDIKKKIKLHLSDIEDNRIYELSNQYLFINSDKDFRFYDMIESLFIEDESLSKKQIMTELKKCIKSRLDLNYPKYSKNKLIEELKDKKFKYQIPLSINFKLKENNKQIIEYADFTKNNDIDSGILYEDIVTDNEYSLLSDYSFDGNIYLYDAYDFYQHSKMENENKNFILGRYYLKVIKNLKTEEHKKFIREYKSKFNDFNKKYFKLTEFGQNNLNKEIEKIINDSYSNISKVLLNGISFINKPLLDKKININKLYNNLVVSMDIPFIYYIGDKTGLSKIKLYEPSYYGDNATIKKEKLKEWKNVKLLPEEKELYSKKNILILVLNINNYYIKFHINNDAIILVNNYQLKDSNISINDIIKNINSKIIAKINTIISLNKIDKISEDNIKLIELNGSKRINIHENLFLNIDNSNLNHLLNYYNDFIYFKNKQNEKDINRYLEIKNNYGIKRIRGYGSKKSIEREIYLIIYGSDNKLNETEIINKIKMNFNLPYEEIKIIYKNIIKDLNDRRDRVQDNKQIDILSIIRKMIKDEKNNCIIQFNIPSDILEFNYSFIRDFNEFKFINNFLDMICKEFLLNKKYKETKQIKDLVKQETILQKKIEDKVQKEEKQQKKEKSIVDIKVKRFEENDTRRRIDFNSSNSNNSNNNSDNSDNSNNNSNNNSKNNYNKNKLNENKNIKNNESEKVEENIKQENNNVDKSIRNDIESRDLKDYFKKMKEIYDPEIIKLDKKRNTKDIYSRRCQPKERLPIIISKRKLVEIEKNPEYLRGLDIFEYKKGNKKEVNYFIKGGKNNKNIYICPRIWCVKCELPINPKTFTLNQSCPKCGGLVLQNEKQKIDSKHTLYIRKEKKTKKDKYWIEKEGDSFLSQYLDELGEGQKIDMPEIIKDINKGIYPEYLPERTSDEKIRLVCCGKKPTGLKAKTIYEKSIKEQTRTTGLRFYFIKEKDRLNEYRLGLPTNDINILLGNKHIKELSDKVDAKKYTYIFRMQDRDKLYKTDNKLKNQTKLFRLGVDYDKNESFLRCINSLYFIKSPIKNENKNLIFKKIQEIKPSLFIQLLEGNIVELFRNEKNIKYLEESELKKVREFVNEYSDDLKKIGIDSNKEINDEFYYLYSAFTNFKKYTNDNTIKKDYNIYWDLVSREGFLYSRGRNIIIIEKSNKSDKSKINLLCPKYLNEGNYFDISKETIILIKIDEYFEPIVSVYFRKENVHDTTHKIKTSFLHSNASQDMKQLFNIFIKQCKIKSKINRILNIDELELILKDLKNNNFKIKSYVRGKYPKILGVLLNNNLYIPISPCGFRPNFLGKIIYDKELENNLLTFEEHNNIISEYSQIEELVKTKNILVNKVLNIVGILTNREAIIPLKERELNTKDIGKAKFYDFDINDLIYNTKKSGDLRKKEVYKYENNRRDFKNVILAINRFMLDINNKDIKNEILLIIKNKVLPLNKKRNDILKIFRDNKIFDKLFNFTEIKSKKINVDDKYSQGEKIDINKKNLLNGKDNSKLFLNMIIEKLIRNTKEGIILIKKKIEIYEIKSILSVDAEKQIDFNIDSIDKVINKLYSKKKVKYVRNINTYNTKKMLKERNYNSIQNNNKKSIYPLQQNAREPSVNEFKSVESIIHPILELKGSKKNMFGIVNKKDDKIKEGKCIFPFSMITKPINPETGKKESSGFGKNRFECMPSSDGPFCPTQVLEKQVKRIRKRSNKKNNFKKTQSKKGVKEYMASDKHPSKKGYCEWGPYLERIKKYEQFKDKKLNPNCKKSYIIKRGKKEIHRKGNNPEDICLPEQQKIIGNKKKTALDKPNEDDPLIICPTELEKNKYFMLNKENNTEECFV